MKKIKLLSASILVAGACSAVAAPMQGDIPVPLTPKEGEHFVYPEAQAKTVNVHCYLSGETKITSGKVSVWVGNKTEPKTLNLITSQFTVNNVKTKGGELKIEADSADNLQMTNSSGDYPYVMYCHYGQ